MEKLELFLCILLCVYVLLLIIGVIISGSTVVMTDISKDNYKEGMIYYFLPQTLLKITSTTKIAIIYNSTDNTLTDLNRIIEQKFIVTTENIADTRELLALKYQSNAFMSDYLKYQINDKGLIDSVKVITEDETAAIINTITKISEQKSNLEQSNPESILQNTTLIIKEYSTDFHVIASEIMGSEKIIDWGIHILNELGREEYKTVDASFIVQIDKDKQEQTPKSIQEMTLTEQKFVKGILTRPVLNTNLKITTNLATGQKQQVQVFVRIIDQDKLINIPITRTVFVKRESELIFEEGLIKSNEITNPSSLKGFASIPIDVAKSIISIPAQLLQFRYDNTVRLTNLENQKALFETRLLENEKFQISRNNEIEKLISEVKADELTRKNDSKILILELQRKLLEAEKNQLDMLNQLNQLKKNIEGLKNQQ